ncbi:hypothetical protein Nepgr_009621 [Nepenthes gracilis]|uniref:Uncharacterized protein n=1 Tax=Nepenthes gracilis TaxID=150966 RepID=A0AAD3SBD9_NEPGR|nr:hypothetical protein Nepgr_009621 [Nepenthes gracilis]
MRNYSSRRLQKLQQATAGSSCQAIGSKQARVQNIAKDKNDSMPCSRGSSMAGRQRSGMIFQPRMMAGEGGIISQGDQQWVDHHGWQL